MTRIIVKSPREGFRRAGIAFSTAGTELDTDSLSKAQLAAIRADPGLLVSDAPEPKQKAPKKDVPDAEPESSTTAEVAPAADAAPAKAGKK